MRQSEDGRQQKELTVLLEKMGATCRRPLNSFDDELRKAFRGAELPADGTVHEITANVRVSPYSPVIVCPWALTCSCVFHNAVGHCVISV